MLPPNHPYHLHPDGTFQIDRYRMEATAMRREAMRRERRPRSAVKLVVVLAAILLTLGAAVSPWPAAHGSTSANLAAARTAANAAAERTPTF